MALIPIEEISNLKSASEVKSVADTALDIIEEQQVAKLINIAANAGQHSAMWQHDMSDELKTKLESMGYTVYKKSNAAIPNHIWYIGGF